MGNGDGKVTVTKLPDVNMLRDIRQFQTQIAIDTAKLQIRMFTNIEASIVDGWADRLFNVAIHTAHSNQQYVLAGLEYILTLAKIGNIHEVESYLTGIESGGH